MKFVPRKHSTSPFTNPFFTSGEWCEVKICILEDLCLSVMCLYIKGGFPINIFPLHAFVPESVIFWHTCKYSSVRCSFDGFLMCYLHDSIFYLSTFVSVFFCNFHCFLFIWVTFHPCSSFLKRLRMQTYKTQLLYCLLVLSNLHGACWPCLV